MRSVIDKKKQLQNEESKGTANMDFRQFDQKRERRRIERQTFNWIPDHRHQFLRGKRKMPD